MVKEKLFLNSLFKNIDDDLLTKFLSISQKKEYSVGDLILEEDKDVDGIYYITEGIVNIVKKSKKNPIFITSLGNNSLFGEMSFITDQTASASVIAQTDVKVIFFPGTDVFDFFNKYPQFGINFLLNMNEELCIRLKKTTNILSFHLTELEEIVTQDEIDELLSNLK